jgi:prevent-host-death family protein
MSKPAVVGIGEFRQRATELIRSVEEEGLPITITRRGVPVAELRPIPASKTILTGSVIMLDDVDLTDPVIDPSEWSATL